MYEYGYQLGYRALFSLRPGESMIREAGNRGLHINGNKGWEGLKAKAPDQPVKDRNSSGGLTFRMSLGWA